MLTDRLRSQFISVLLVLLLLPAVLAFDCRLDLPSSNGKKGKDVHFDLGPLDGEHSASKTTQTPPTTNEAKVRLRLCGDEGLKRDTEMADEDQCPDGTKVCLTLLNHKSSSSEGARVTAVIPIWSTGTGEDDIKVSTRENDQGLDVSVNGAEYAGGQQRLKLHLVCSSDSDDNKLAFDSYSDGTLTMTWSTPDACPKAADGSEDVPTPEEKAASSGSGVGKFFKFVFWMLFSGLFFYFVIGMYYNYTTYGSRGLDLLPHKDFWIDLPTMMSDLFSHIASNVRGGSSSGTSRRSGYTSLG
ncbi:autophagy-related protein 27 [Filobasidium floriforme]|uniref:autophagy-related protein 27 n=1 Tax=Filobasidium floriforme TaxID=5210 RepID=UPI001E8D1A24|nr:autophagy-related protein 27 [Filobasidium floriforme]KAH8090717.1 autophagy-related protein 27 [Filobasidium floriforme]